MRLFTPKAKNRAGTVILVVCDIATLVGLFYLSVFVRKSVMPYFLDLPGLFVRLRMYYWIFPVWFLILLYNGAYTRRFTFWDEVKFLWKAILFTAVAVFTVLFIGRLGTAFSRTLILTMCFVSFLLQPIIRTYVKKALNAAGLLKRKVIIVGAGESARMALLALNDEPNMGYEVAGFVDDSPSVRSIEGIKVHGFIDKLDRYIKFCGVQDVLIAKPELEKEKLTSIINLVQHKADNILYLPDFSGIAVLGTELRHFFKEQALLIEIKNNLAMPLNRLTKFLFDYLSGVVMFIFLLVPMALLSLLIKLNSRGPAIYLQERIGRGGRPFKCYKFRTMYSDAEERLKKILDYDPKAKAEWEKYYKLKDDPRVTTVGMFLRKTSLDELPQLLNVLKGEMSLVGPRPVTQNEIDVYYKDTADLCFSVRPGITGLWQISGRSNTGYDYRIALDSWYVRNWNLWLDIVILFKTLRVVFRKEGAF